MAFFALPISSDIQSRLTEGLGVFKKEWPEVQWVHPEDYHLTLRFLGGLPADALARLLVAVQDETVPWTPFTLELQGLRCFPPHHDRGVLWIGLQHLLPALVELQERLEQQVQKLGFTPEKRPFTPHLTVGRFQGSQAGPIMKALPALADRSWGTVTCEEYVLMKRRSGARDHAAGPSYEVLAQFSV